MHIATDDELRFVAPLAAPPPPPVPDEALLTAKHVKQWFGRTSDMALYRWIHDPKIGFPQPDVHIGSRRYWYAGTLRRWLRQQKG